MFKIDINHFGHEFWCVAEGWKDESSASVSCNFLKAAVRELSPSETRDLYAALSRSNEAFEDDPIWTIPILQSLCQMQEAAKRAGLQQAAVTASEESMCSCRLIPGLAT